MKVTLLEHPLSPYAQKNKICLREKGIEFELISFNNRNALEESPRGQVPTLRHNDQLIFDSRIIQQYIEEYWPNPPMAPKAPAERARVRMIEEIMDTQYEAAVWGMMEVQAFGRAPGAVGEELSRRAQTQLCTLHEWLERELGTRPWFNGHVFGWGDIAVVPHLLCAIAQGVGPKSIVLQAWLSRALDREGVALTAAEATASAQASEGMAQAALSSGSYQREYRDHRLEWMIRAGGINVVLDGIAKGNIRFSREIR